MFMNYFRPKKTAFYNHNASRFCNPYFKPRKNIQSRRQFFYHILLISIALSAWTYFLFFSNYFSISDWEIKGLDKYEKKAVEAVLENFLDKKKFGLIHYEGIFTFNEGELNKEFSSEFAFQNIEVQKIYPHKIILNLQEKNQKMAVYNDENIYILSDDGVITDIEKGIGGWHLPAQQGMASGTDDSTVDIKKIVDDSQKRELPAYPIFCDAYSMATDLRVNSVYPLAKTIKIINDFIDRTQDRTELAVKSALITKNKIGQKIILYTTNGWTIYLNNEDDGVRQFYKLYLAMGNELKDLSKPVEYIDLRFGDRVYIKK